MMKSVYYILLSVNILVLLFAMIKRNTKTYLSLLLLLIIALVCEKCGEHFEQNTYNWLHCYEIAEIVLLSIFYYNLLENTKHKKYVIIVFILHTFFNGLHYLINPQAFNVSNYLDFILNAIAIIIYSILYFFDTLNSSKVIEHFEQPAFYVTAGNLFFYGGSVLVMGFVTILEQTGSLQHIKLMYFNYGLNLLLYTLYLIAFLCLATTKKKFY